MQEAGSVQDKHPSPWRVLGKVQYLISGRKNLLFKFGDRYCRKQ